MGSFRNLCADRVCSNSYNVATFRSLCACSVELHCRTKLRHRAIAAGCIEFSTPCSLAKGRRGITEYVEKGVLLRGGSEERFCVILC